MPELFGTTRVTLLRHAMRATLVLITLAVILGNVQAELVRAVPDDQRQGRACVIPPDPSSRVVGNPPPSSEFPFTEVSAEAGIDYVHGPLRVPPNCLLTDFTFKSTKCESEQCRELHRRSVNVNIDVNVPDHSAIELPGTLCEAEYGLGAATTADIDGDGFPDILVSRTEGSPILYRNKGDGTFEDITKECGLGGITWPSSGANMADLDNDGDIDIFITSVGTNVHRFYLYINDGAGSFTEQALERGVAASSPHAHIGSSVAIGDYDNDGFLDIHTTEWAQEGHSPLDRLDDRYPWFATRLFRNLGKLAPGYFEDTTKAANLTVGPINTHFKLWQKQGLNGTYNLASAFVDLDEDGWLDLIVNGDFGTSRLYWNNRGVFENGFEHITRDMNAMGLAIGDIDQDGDLDYYVTQIYDEAKQCESSEKVESWCGIGWVGSVVYLNEGNRVFIDATERPEYQALQKTYWAWGTSFLDFDNDGDDDLYVVNGFTLPGTTAEDEYNLTPNQFFENVNGTFVETMPRMWENQTEGGRATFTFDYDNDGDQDIFIVNNAGRPELWRNDAPDQGHWLRVRTFSRPMTHTADDGFHGHSPVPNCKVFVKASPDHPWRVQHTGVRSHFGGVSEAETHFGLGENVLDTLDLVLIHWPVTNVTLVIRGQTPIDHTLEVTQPSGRDSVYVVKLRVPKCADKESMFEDDEGPKDSEDYSLNVAESRRLNDIVTSAIENRYNQPYAPNPAVALKGIENLISRADDEDVMLRDISGIPADSLAHDNHTLCGAPGRNLRRLLPSAYADGKSVPSGPNRPSARVVSNIVATQSSSRPNQVGLNDIFVAFGQFLSHDMDLTTPMYRPTQENSFPILVPKGDTYFDVKGTGLESLRFKRSMYDARTVPREQFNKVTAFIDGSMIYGSSWAKANHLRTDANDTLHRGELRTNNEYPHFLPFNKGSFENDNPMSRRVDGLTLAGDPRSNASPGLAVMHTLFLREHNRIASAIAAKSPSLSSDKVYHAARRAVTAMLQHIVYSEYLPQLLGPEYAGRVDPHQYQYNESACLDTSNAFTTAAFRFGHSQVNTQVLRFDQDWNPHHFGHLSLRDAFFHPKRLFTEGGVDPVIRGMLVQTAQDIDPQAVDDVRNFLFGSSKLDGGLDLTAANIQRGRDHGLPDYASARKQLGLKPVTSFDDISQDQELNARLAITYSNDINNIDLYIGGLAEDHVQGGAVGELFATILSEQFARARDNDSLFYTRRGVFTSEELKEIEAVTLADIISRNSGVSDMSHSAFQVHPLGKLQSQSRTAQVRDEL